MSRSHLTLCRAVICPLLVVFLGVSCAPQAAPPAASAPTKQAATASASTPTTPTTPTDLAPTPKTDAASETAATPAASPTAELALPGAAAAPVASDASALKAAAALYGDIREEVLPNGLRVFLKPIPESPVVTTIVSVEVAEYWYQWHQKLAIPITSEAACVETHVKGFFGQNAGIPTAIEGMVYDAFPLGGDGGATHYHNTATSNMGLSALLNGHDLGEYFNCTDNMGATTTMLSMMGVKNVRPIRLGSMTLRAIWGIGAPGYTTDLWGGGSHGFSYHHIVTRDDAIHVIDSCMQLDEDGDPNTTPGTLGWNNDRTWAGPGGYENLSASNPVSKTLETLPGLE
jgi:hypothetical protein